jgi:hypothetical protein
MNIPVIKDIKKPSNEVLIAVGGMFAITLILIGVATAIKSIADWGAEHQFVKQKVVALHIQAPYRIEKIQPIKELVVLNTPFQELSSTEQKIVKIWKDYKTAMIAIAIFDCGESGLIADAVSSTGDLGVAQINWKIWKNPVKEKFGYTAIDMFSVDKNLEVAYWIWDRGDGIEGNDIGSWEAWSGYKNNNYLRCFE